MLTDPIADLLTRLRNASRAGHPTAVVPASREKMRVLKVLLDEGYILRAEEIKGEGGKDSIKVYLRYTPEGLPALRELKRYSKPGRRQYVRSGDIPRCKGGLGTVIVSTSQGVLTDRDARAKGIGGELVCSVF